LAHLSSGQRSGRGRCASTSRTIVTPTVLRKKLEVGLLHVGRFARCWPAAPISSQSSAAADLAHILMKLVKSSLIAPLVSATRTRTLPWLK
jgi:hypothetical protein